MKVAADRRRGIPGREVTWTSVPPPPSPTTDASIMTKPRALSQVKYLNICSDEGRGAHDVIDGAPGARRGYDLGAVFIHFLQVITKLLNLMFRMQELLTSLWISSSCSSLRILSTSLSPTPTTRLWKSSR